jgi:hypothetical protein
LKGKQILSPSQGADSTADENENMVVEDIIDEIFLGDLLGVGGGYTEERGNFKVKDLL